MKYKVISVDHFYDNCSSCFYGKGRCYEFDEAMKIVELVKKEKEFNGFVHYSVGIIPVEDKEADKFNKALDEHHKLCEDLRMGK